MWEKAWGRRGEYMIGASRSIRIDRGGPLDPAVVILPLYTECTEIKTTVDSPTSTFFLAWMRYISSQFPAQKKISATYQSLRILNLNPTCTSQLGKTRGHVSLSPRTRFRGEEDRWRFWLSLRSASAISISDFSGLPAAFVRYLT